MFHHAVVDGEDPLLRCLEDCLEVQKVNLILQIHRILMIRLKHEG